MTIVIATHEANGDKALLPNQPAVTPVIGERAAEPKIAARIAFKV
jgi:hypothetical protein